MGLLPMFPLSSYDNTLYSRPLTLSLYPVILYGIDDVRLLRSE